MTEPRAPDTVPVLAGIAQYLAGAGLVRYNPTGVYTNTGLPVVLFGQLPDSPDDAVLINLYNQDNTRDDGTPDYYLQLRFRTAGRDPRTTEALADAAFHHLHNLTHHTWSGVRVLSCRRHIRGPIDPDQNGRYTRPDSYRVVINPSQLL